MKSKWWTLTAIVVAVFMLLIDITIVNVALPDIATELHASFSSLEWVVNAYTLTLASSLLVSGSLADLFGRRLVFVTGLVAFTGASFACALAETPTALNLLRGVEGIGGGMMFATSLAIIAQTYRGRDRAVAFGIVGAVTGAAVAVGPLAGGILTDSFGWEAVFLINVPIGIFAVVLALRAIEESKDPHPAGIDWAGAVTFTASLFLLVFGLIDGNNSGWGSPKILGCLIGSAVLLGTFVHIEKRQDHPLFDLSLFRKPAFVGASVAAMTMSASLFSLFLFLTFYLQGGVLGYSPLEAGLRFLPITLMMLLVGPIAGRLTGIVKIRYLISAGLTLTGIGIFLMHGIDIDSAWTTLIAGSIIAGAGSGLVNPPLASTAVGVVEVKRSGMASGINSTFRQVGIASGIAGLGAIFQHRVQDLVGKGLAGTPAASHADQLAGAVTSGQTDRAIAAIPANIDPNQVAQIEKVAHSAFVSGLNEILLIAAVIALIGAVATLILIRPQDFVEPPGVDGNASR